MTYIDRQLNEHNGILLCLFEEGNTVVCGNMNKFQGIMMIGIKTYTGKTNSTQLHFSVESKTAELVEENSGYYMLGWGDVHQRSQYLTILLQNEPIQKNLLYNMWTIINNDALSS